MANKTIKQVQADSEILAETNRNCLKEIETLKAQLADKALIIAELNTVAHELKDNAIHQEQVIEDISRTAKVRLENYDDLLVKFESLLSENDLLKETLKAVL